LKVFLLNIFFYGIIFDIIVRIIIETFLLTK